MSIKNNITSLQEILNKINALPEAGNNTSDATAMSEDILEGKIAYSKDGKITGTIATFDGSYECSGESTGGSGEDVTDEVNAYAEKLVTLETAITALEQELEGKASGGGVATCTIEIIKKPAAWILSDLRGLFFVAYENGEYKGYGGIAENYSNNLPSGFDFYADQNTINNVVCGSMIYIDDINATASAPAGFNQINPSLNPAYFIVPPTPNATHTVTIGI